MSWSSPYFTHGEMACKCGKCDAVEMMDPGFMEKLTALRGDWGQPMIINSAYRCSLHPVEQRKEKPGAHAQGRAADIAISGEDAYKFLCVALGHGFTGIGVAQKGNHSSRFIHIDDLDETEAYRPTVWSY